jgi:hypothetical protein
MTILDQSEYGLTTGEIMPITKEKEKLSGDTSMNKDINFILQEFKNVLSNPEIQAGVRQELLKKNLLPEISKDSIRKAFAE